MKITARRLGRAVIVSLAPAGRGLAESIARTPSPRPAVEPCSLDRRVPRTPVQSVQGTWRWKNPWGGDGGEQLWVRRPGPPPLASVRFQDIVSGGHLPTLGQRTQALKTSLRKEL